LEPARKEYAKLGKKLQEAGLTRAERGAVKYQRRQLLAEFGPALRKGEGRVSSRHFSLHKHPNDEAVLLLLDLAGDPYRRMPLYVKGGLYAVSGGRRFKRSGEARRAPLRKKALAEALRKLADEIDPD